MSTNFAVADFDTIKQSLVGYLSSQPQFSGYNFAGSNLNILIDLLAYNTYTNMLYNNMSLNEQFIETAQLRNTVIQRCNEMGYLPNSARSSRAAVNIHVSSRVSGNPSILYLPALTRFNTMVDGRSYVFQNINAVTTTVNPDGSYDFSNVAIYEGVALSMTYINDGMTKFVIPNPNCDTSTVSVSVQNSATDITTTVFASFNDITTVDFIHPVYFLRESSDQTYEVYFGQDGFGVGLNLGNLVTISYLVSSLDGANGANQFTFQGTLNGGAVSLTTIDASAGGVGIESIDSIKFNAPLQYLSQNRAISATDYSVITKQIWPSAQSISVWGGEDNYPPKYGNVFMCIYPKMTTNQKTYVIGKLSAKAALTTNINIIDPDFINIFANISVHYNTLKTKKTPSLLQSNIASSIDSFATSNLNTFSSIFRYSQFTSMIDTVDSSIMNNNTVITAQRIINPSSIYYNAYSNYSFILGNKIEYTGNPEEAVLSSGFYITSDPTNIYYIDDDGVGNLRLFYYDSTYTKIIVNSTIGTVNYSGTSQSQDGVIQINNISISQVVGNSFYFMFKLQSYDVVGYQNQIVQLLSYNVSINMIPEFVSSVASGNTNYTFGNNK